MGDLVGAGPELSYSERKERMATEGFAVWDVLESAVRPGSLDAAIEAKTAKPNDFVEFLREHPGIWRVCFNGQKAAEMFDRRVMAGIEGQASSMVFVTLPSTSPAHAAMRYEEKLERWSIIMTGPEVVQENS
jgi:hypoxanthine-DNA glycosylase